MIRSIADLRAASDEELIKEHDHHAKNTNVGTAYYMEELQRRQQNSSMETMKRSTFAVADSVEQMVRLSQRMDGMTKAITVATIINVVLTIVLIVLTVFLLKHGG